MEKLISEENIKICGYCKEKHERIIEWDCSKCGERGNFIDAVELTITKILLK